MTYPGTATSGRLSVPLRQPTLPRSGMSLGLPETSPPTDLSDAGALATPGPLMTYSMACGVSLLLHAALLLILASWLLVLGSGSVPVAAINTTFSDPDQTPQDFEAPLAPLVAERDDQQAARIEVETVAAVSPSLSDAPLPEPALGELHPGEQTPGANAGRKKVGFFGAEAEGRSFVFIVDCSDSMNTDYRFRRAMTELYSAISKLEPEQQFFVILYNHQAVPMTSSPKYQHLRDASRTELLRVRSWLRKRKAFGGTIPDEALRMGLRMKPEVIFFLSDGDFNRTARNVAREANQSGTIIHTIAFGFRGGEELLRGIADDHHGRYRFVE